VRRRNETRLLSLIIVVALTTLTACVEPGDNSEVIIGSSPTEKLNHELADLGVTLPPDSSQLEWIMANTWDTNDTFVRLTAPRSSVQRLLSQSHIEEGSLQPLAKAEDYDWVFPGWVLSGIPANVSGVAKDIDWSLSATERMTAVAYVQEHQLPAAGAIVLHPQATRPVVMIHWYR
jgi:hypothetical protein